MSYHEAKLAPLSKKQVSKLLNGHPVRVSHGNHHLINLSLDHLKKLHRAGLKGSGITITLDPYAIAHNQHLRHDVGMLVKKYSGGKIGLNLGKSLSGNVATLGDAGTGYLVGQMGGEVMPYHTIRRGGKIGKKLGKSLSRNVATLADAGTEYLVKQMLGKKIRGGKIGLNLGKSLSGNVATLGDAGTGYLVGQMGGKLSNKLKHGQQVMDFMGHNYQGIAHAVKPVAVPILGALTQRAVNAINPVQGAVNLGTKIGDSLKHLFGGKLKFKHTKPHLLNESVIEDSYSVPTGELYGVGLKKHVHRVKRVMSEAQKAALAKGRHNLRLKLEEMGAGVKKHHKHHKIRAGSLLAAGY